MSLIASTIVAAITPYLAKTGEKIAEKIGEDIFPTLKRIFIKDEEKKTLELVQANPNPQNLRIFEQQLSLKLDNSPNLAQDFADILKLNPHKSIRLAGIVNSINSIKEELEYLYQEKVNAGISTEGDYSNRIALQERKLLKLEREFFQILK